MGCHEISEIRSILAYHETESVKDGYFSHRTEGIEEFSERLFIR